MHGDLFQTGTYSYMRKDGTGIQNGCRFISQVFSVFAVYYSLHFSPNHYFFELSRLAEENKKSITNILRMTN